jgi:hypothetical protein
MYRVWVPRHWQYSWKSFGNSPHDQPPKPGVVWNQYYFFHPGGFFLQERHWNDWSEEEGSDEGS